MSWRRLEDILQDVLKTSWKTKNCYAEDVLKTCLEDVLKTCLEDVLKTLWRQTKYLLGISVSNKSKCVSSKSIFHKSIFLILRRIQNALIRTHRFNIPLILKLRQHLPFKWIVVYSRLFAFKKYIYIKKILHIW